MRETDLAIVGGGIVGLAFALAHAKRGRKVALFEREAFAIGASVRNFGLLWPVGQPAGAAHDRAMLSRQIWLDVISRTKLWHAPTGSMHLAYAEDELAVLEEYAASIAGESLGREMLSGSAAAERCAARADGLLGALWSPTEINIDPREAIRKIPALLEAEHNVELNFGVHVRDVSLPTITTSAGEWRAQEAIICSGADFETLFPEVFHGSGLTRCKLQMLRTAPQAGGWQLGATLCAGLTLAHYDSFKGCASLPALKERFKREFPFCVEHGIHVLLSQTAQGELTIGDSHHYGVTLEPFDREDINEEILSYLRTFAKLPSYEVAERWNGTYPKLSGRTEFVAKPAPGVTVVTGLGGAGMTMSFGLAEQMASGAYHGSEKVLT